MNYLKNTFLLLPILFIISFQSQGQKISSFEKIKNAEKIAVVKDFMLLDPSLGASYIIGKNTSYRTSFALVPKDFDQLTLFIAETINKQFDTKAAHVVDNEKYVVEKNVMGMPGKVFEFNDVDEDLFARVIYTIVYFNDPTSNGEYQAITNVTLTFFADEGKSVPKTIKQGKHLIGHYQEDLGTLKNHSDPASFPNIEYFLENYPPTQYIDAVKFTIPEGINDMYKKLEKKYKKKK